MTDKGQFDTLKNCIIRAMQEKKALEIVSIDLTALNNRLTDMFIVCHGTSDKHVGTIAQHIEEEVSRELSDKPNVREGFENKEWILLDFFDIVIHVFQEEKREFFALESLWGDGIKKNYNDNN